MRTSFSVSDMTIHRIVELEQGSTPLLEFLPGLSIDVLEENRSWLEPSALDPKNGNAILCYQSYIVRTPHHTVLVDSCIGNDKNRPRPSWDRKRDDSYMRGLAAAGVSVEDIDFVLCTHLHADHVGWNTRLENGRWAPTFPKARYLFSAKEYAYFAEQHAKTPSPSFDDSVLPIIAAQRADLVSSAYALDDHVRLIPTPGHTPDHFSVCFGAEGDAAVLTGDLFHSPLQTLYPELSVRFDYDTKKAAATRRAFLERYCDTSTLCCTAHFPSPSVGRIVRWGDGFRHEAV